MIKIAICDDDKKVMLEIRRRIEKCLKEMKQIAQISTYQSGEYLLYEIQENKFFDLMLVDIEMPGKNGMDIAKLVKQVSPETLVIFITSHSEYAIDSYELSVFRYIPKENIDIKLSNAVRDAIEYIELKRDKDYVIATPTRYERIPYDRIIYIQKDAKVLRIVTNTGETYVRKNISQVYEELEDGQFVYLDRGCIANILHIMCLDERNVIMRDGVALRVSKQRMVELKKILNEFWAERI